MFCTNMATKGIHKTITWCKCFSNTYVQSLK